MFSFITFMDNDDKNVDYWGFFIEMSTVCRARAGCLCFFLSFDVWTWLIICTMEQNFCLCPFHVKDNRVQTFTVPFVYCILEYNVT